MVIYDYLDASYHHYDHDSLADQFDNNNDNYNANTCNSDRNGSASSHAAPRRPSFEELVVGDSIPVKESRLLAPLCASDSDLLLLDGIGAQRDCERLSLLTSPRRDSRFDCTAPGTRARLIWVNVISVLINLTLAAAAFYFAFVDDSSATGAFAADCVLDFVSSAIVLWRYFGQSLTSEFARAREQIACLYLGALFELSSLAIIVKAGHDMLSSGPADLEPLEESARGGRARDAPWGTGSAELVCLAAVASVACMVLTLFKCALYRQLGDNSILLDVLNTLISSIFALGIVMSQLLISVDSSFWYLDPVLSILLALFMMAIGFKVLHENRSLLLRQGRAAAPTTPASCYERNLLLSNNNADRRGGGTSASITVDSLVGGDRGAAGQRHYGSLG